MREEEFSRVLRKVKHFFSKCFPVAQFGDRNNVTCCREKSVAYQKKNTVREAFFFKSENRRLLWCKTTDVATLFYASI